MTRDARRESDWLGTLVMIGAALVLAITIYLRLDHRRSVAEGGWDQPATPEMRIVPAWIIDESGDTVRVLSESEATILIWYHTSCPFCRASALQWQRLLEVSCEREFRVAFVSVEAIAAQSAFLH